jgi:putative ABC transport system ATP-binding protein
MDQLVRAEKLCKYYGKGSNLVKAVDQVNLTIAHGEFVSIIGKSGSGKSTLLHLLGGLDYPTDGKVWLGGEDMFALREQKLAVLRRQKIGFVFQAFNLVSSLNVWENIVLPIGLNHEKPDVAFVESIIRQLGIQDRLKHLPNTLSGGEQQRTAIARALASSPDIIFADEPTGNLDSKTGEEVLSLFQMSAKRLGQTLVMVTHDEDIAQAADRIIMMEDGRIVSRTGVNG